MTEVVTISDRMILNITQKKAAESANQARELPVTSMKTFRFTLTGNNNRSITDFEVQGTALLFSPGAVSANETITVNVEDSSGTYVGASAIVSLDENRLGSAELVLTEKGSFRLGSLTGPAATLLIFDSTGNCIQSGTAQSGMSSGTLDAGNYRVVLLQKSDLLRSVPDLNYLGTLGLVSGQDYLLREITISDGSILRLGDCAVPSLNESALSYTVADNTSLTTSKSSGAAVGEIVLVRAAYELDSSKGVSDSNLTIVLPDGLSPMENNPALVDGKQVPYTYDASRREARISMAGQGRAVVYLYCGAVKSGSHSISAYLTLSNGAVQPIGTAVVQAENAKLNVPEKVGIAQGLTASGKTFPNSTVTLYDNDTEVGHTTSNAAGSWSMKFDLVQPVYSYSYHFVRAVTEISGLSEPISTEEIMITYSKGSAGQLKKITMYNRGDHGPQETVFDFDFMDTTSTTVPYYRIWPSRYPTFTFKVEFTGDTSELSEVYVVTTNSAGDETYVKTSYDAESGAWVGTHDYKSFNDAPVSVGAAYGGEYIRAAIDKELIEDLEELFVSEQKVIFEQINAALADSFTFTDLDMNGDVAKATIVCKDQDTQDPLFSTHVQAEASIIDGSITANDLIQQGCTLYDEQENVWYRDKKEILYGQDGMPKEVHAEGEYTIPRNSNDPNSGVKVKISADVTPTQSFKYGGSTAEDITEFLSNMAAIGGFVVGSAKELSIAADVISAGPAWEAWHNKYGKLGNQTPTVRKALGDLFDEGKTSNLTKNLKHLGVATNVASGIISVADGVVYHNKWDNILKGNVKTWSGILEVAKETLAQPPEYCAIPDNVRNQLEKEIKQLESDINLYQYNASQKINKKAAEGIFSSVGMGIFGNIANIGAAEAAGTVVGGTAIGGTALGAAVVGFIGVVAAYDIMAWSWYFGERGKAQDNAAAISAILQGQEGIIDQIDHISMELKKYCSTNPFSGLIISTPQKSSIAIHDPSGFVYEAVPSNRLEDVTAVISCEADNGADWNAEAYDQINPQITGTDGGYYWDVPQGNWKVSFTKNGYENADTSKVAAAVGGWLPVPPPQLEINVGMVSTASPAVKQAVAYKDRIEVEFSQYMDIGSVGAALSLSCDGAPVDAITVEALNAEYNLENTEQYATRFAIVPNSGNLSGTLTVSVSGSAENYAGKRLQSSYTSPALMVTERPTDIAVPAKVSIILHQPISITAVLQPGIAGQKLTVESLSPALVTVGSGEVTTGIDGSVEISLTGSLPGSGMIRISDPASGLSKTIDVQIGAVRDVPPVVSVSPVIATLEDGTAVTNGMTVAKGTKIVLDTSTPGAAIHYTLDDTCPCMPEAFLYENPVTITGKTVLRAVAYRNGVYSETIRLELDVKISDSGEAPPSGDDGGDNGDDGADSGNDGVDSGNDGVDSGGGGGDTPVSNYNITVSEDITGGTVTVSSAKVKKGGTVTITVTPQDGYALDKLTATDSKGTQLPLTDHGNGKHTFTMPDSEITVDASFTAANLRVSFTDVQPDAYYYDSVVWAVGEGITSGTSAATFSPNESCTRGEVVTFLWRAAGSPEPQGGENPFLDVQPGAYYASAVQWAAEQGITTGTSGTTFSPDIVITRGQAVTFLYRAAGSLATEGGESFQDVSPTAYYAQAVQWAVHRGVTCGTGENTFSPYSDCTRSQIVTFIFRNRVAANAA